MPTPITWLWVRPLIGQEDMFPLAGKITPPVCLTQDTRKNTKSTPYRFPRYIWCLTLHFTASLHTQTHTSLLQFAVTGEFVHDTRTRPPTASYLSQTVLQRSNINMGAGVRVRERHDSQSCLTPGIIMPLHFSGQWRVKRWRNNGRLLLINFP